jgi:hypothetical protein
MARCPTAVELRQTIQTKPLSLYTSNYRVSSYQQALVFPPKERREGRGGSRGMEIRVKVLRLRHEWRGRRGFVKARRLDADVRQRI